MPRTIPRGDFCKVNQISGSELYVTLYYPIPRYTVFTIVFLLCSLRDWTNGETKIADFIQSAYFIIAHRIIPSIKKRMEGSPVTFSLIQGSNQFTNNIYFTFSQESGQDTLLEITASSDKGHQNYSFIQIMIIICPTNI